MHSLVVGRLVLVCVGALMTALLSVLPVTGAAVDPTDPVGTGSISGVVRGEGAGPLADVLVTTQRYTSTDGFGPVLTMRSDASGEFRFGGLAEGFYSLRFTEAAAHADTAYVAPGPHQGYLQLDGGQQSQVDVTMEIGSTLAGRVVTDDGVPIAGAEVRLRCCSRNSRITDAQGRFTFSHLAAGDYYLRVMAVGVHRETLWPRTANPDYPAEVRLGFDDIRTDIEIPLAAGGSISGTFVNSDDGSAVDTDVIAYQGDKSKAVASAPVRADGSYELAGLTPGSYAVQFSRTRTTRGLWWGGRDRESATRLEVVEGRTVTGIDRSVATNTAVVEGQVVDTDGNPLPDVYVTAVALGYYTTTDASGRYRIEQVESGDQLFAVGRTGYYALPARDAPFDIQGRHEVTVVDGAVTQLPVVLARPSVITGVVTLPDGRPASSVWVDVRSVNPLGKPIRDRGVYTDDEGRYEITDLIYDSYLLTAVPASGSAGRGTYWRRGGDAASAERLVVVAGEDRTGIDIALQPSATISGQVQWVPGMAAPSDISVNQVPRTPRPVLVEPLFDTDPRLGRPAVYGPTNDGQFVVNNLVPGRYRVAYLCGTISALVPFHSVEVEVVGTAHVRLENVWATNLHMSPSGTGTACDKTLPPVTRAGLRPRLAGKARVGRSMRVLSGGFRPTTARVRYRWHVGTKVVPRRSDSRLPLTRKMRGKPIWAEVIATAPRHGTLRLRTPKSARIR